MRRMQQFKTRAQRLRASQTSAEAILWKALRNRQLARWKFRRQHPVDRYIVDFVTIAGKLIVEIDWPTHSNAKTLAHDAERTHILSSLGFHVVRVTNVDVYENLDGVKEMIASTLSSGRGV
jgi:very-short-patch-repair endonuclease